VHLDMAAIHDVPCFAWPCARLPEKHETCLISELPVSLQRRKRLLVTRPCHSKTCIEGAKLGPGRIVEEAEPRMLSGEQHITFAWSCPMLGGRWRGWSKDKRGGLEARWCPDGALIANARADHPCSMLIAGVCTRCLAQYNHLRPMSAQWTRVARNATHGLLHMQKSV